MKVRRTNILLATLAMSSVSMFDMHVRAYDCVNFESEIELQYVGLETQKLLHGQAKESSKF